MKASFFITTGAFWVIAGMWCSFHWTHEYGHNIAPLTTPEAICDLITILMTITGTVMTTIGMAIKK